jgi:hypothetical protein
MKRKSPMQMKKEVKPDARPKLDKKAGRPQSAMERYAQEREKKMKDIKTPPMTVEIHDPHSDVMTLTRAAEIRRNPTRHRAAKSAAKQRIKDLSGITE